MKICLLLLGALLTIHADAQWAIQDSHVKTSLRGVHAVNDRIVWVSGADGVVAHTSDGGSNWQACTVPKGAEKLEFAAIQGSDESTAVVMSTGKGGQSRIYKTADGCRTWKVVFTNPDPVGNFKDIHRVTEKQFYVLGDPVDGKFSLFYSSDGGDNWFAIDDSGLEAEKGETAFAAGPGSLISVGPFLYFRSQGPTSFLLHNTSPKCSSGVAAPAGGCPIAWDKSEVPLTIANAKLTSFSFGARTQVNTRTGNLLTLLVAVGGAGSAATSGDGGKSWKTATLPPAAGCSGLAYHSGSWIAVCADGTEVSKDDGLKWTTLRPASGEPKDDGHNWTSLSLPFAVGDGGRIGKLDLGAIKR
jgi:photosystem II stability/assembly factor-like uncharacterized protein